MLPPKMFREGKCLANSVVLLLLLALCSVRGNPLLGGKIVGGGSTDIRDYPFMLAMYYRDTLHRGSAVIISPSWALSSNNVLYKQSPVPAAVNLTLRAGSTMLSEGGTIHQVAEYISHDQYGPGSDDYDLLLIRVETPFVFGVGVDACVLSTQGQRLPIGVDSQVLGWGGRVSGGVGGPHSEILQVALIPTLDNSKCETAYGVGFITDRMLCAGRPENSALDACSGDEGGPMVVDGVVMGIVSWHFWQGCGYFGKPGVYANVASMRDWITATAGV